jgi:hypothetical protein
VLARSPLNIIPGSFGTACLVVATSIGTCVAPSAVALTGIIILSGMLEHALHASAITPGIRRRCMARLLGEITIASECRRDFSVTPVLPPARFACDDAIQFRHLRTHPLKKAM